MWRKNGKAIKEEGGEGGTVATTVTPFLRIIMPFPRLLKPFHEWRLYAYIHL